MTLALVIGNKAYSSWSLRPWLAMKMAGLTFEEILIPLQQPGTKAEMLKNAPNGQVPALHHDGVTVWESIAILEYVNERLAEGRLWPQDGAARALARSISAEMHAGFGALRGHCPMNVRRRPEPYPLTPEAARDVARIEAIWRDARLRFGQGGPFLFGAFSNADAMFAPVVNRLHFYALPVGLETRAYMDSVLGLPPNVQWRADAALEPWVIADSERY